MVDNTREVNKVMHMDCILKLYFVESHISNLTQHVSSCPLVIQLVHWSCHVQVLHWKSHSMFNPDFNIIAAALLDLIGFSHLEVGIECWGSVLQTSCESISLDSLLQARWLLWGVELPYQLVLKICLEWSHHHRPAYHIILSLFC
jgi:hypothetical protein